MTECAEELQPLRKNEATEKLSLTARTGHCNWPCGVLLALPVLVIAAVMSLLYPEPSLSSSGSLDPLLMPCLDRVPRCKGRPCFRPSSTRVPTNLPGFPSYWSYAGPMNVSYDERSFLINNERVFFLGGSMHPSRATPLTWSLALDAAVENGLNLITIYVMWSAHQRLANQTLDWTFEAGDWDLAGAIRAAANRGLFVHVRIGPYVCAEYSYGGIPEWLPIKYPEMDMRRYDNEWLDVMEGFVRASVDYLSSHQLWAVQGGPIVAAQIENELGDEDGGFMAASSTKSTSLQQYADWCGQLAKDVAPNVAWTMCNGLSAKNTIATFNGDYFGANWLENYGQSGRIQVDQPAMWTEDEGGFQIWGDEPTSPSDYYWGRNARGMAFNAMQWIARGGTHLNYYMWFGGYNRGRSAAAGIMNMYASDAVLCPSGEPRQPKYQHFQTLHASIAEVAAILLHAPTALFKDEAVDAMDDDGKWQPSLDQRVFRYNVTSGRTTRFVDFLENKADSSNVVKVQLGGKYEHIIEMQPYSSILFIDRIQRFDSSSIDSSAAAFQRQMQHDPVPLQRWQSWQEPIGTTDDTRRTCHGDAPVEQTVLNSDSSVWSDYAWYDVELELSVNLDAATLVAKTAQANALLVHVDGRLVGWSDTHHHKEGDATLNIPLGPVAKGHHRLSILSESLGYGNLIGRWGASTRAKKKGLTGRVTLTSPQLASGLDLVDGRVWKSTAGLQGELSLSRGSGANRTQDTAPLRSCRWSSALFTTPDYNASAQQLFVDLTSGRGHVWLNGVDLGRYWNITRGNSPVYSQRYYFLPHDLLLHNETANELLLFDAFGGTHVQARLLLSWIEPSNDESSFPDETGYLQACLT